MVTAAPAPTAKSSTAATALADGLLELLVGVCGDGDREEASSLAWLVPRGVLLSGQSVIYKRGRTSERNLSRDT